jgi:hypothetical protein
MADDSMLEALRATGPDPELADRLMLFGQFVGAWDLAVTYVRSDGSVTEVPGEWHFGWALEGRAVIDVWIAPRRSLRDGGGGGEYGTSVRFFDPAIDAWRSTWLGPGRRVVMQFTARPIGDEIVLEGSFAEGVLERWIFADIAADRFHWRAVESCDGGATWTTKQTMVARRAQSTATPGSG